MRDIVRPTPRRVDTLTWAFRLRTAAGINRYGGIGDKGLVTSLLACVKNINL